MHGLLLWRSRHPESRQNLTWVLFVGQLDTRMRFSRGAYDTQHMPSRVIAVFDRLSHASFGMGTLPKKVTAALCACLAAVQSAVVRLLSRKFNTVDEVKLLERVQQARRR